MKGTAFSAVVAFCMFALPVHAEYKPGVSTVRDVDTIHVSRDGSTVQLSETLIRIETESGIELYGEQKIYYVSSLEDVEVLEAYTLQPDGTRVPVPTESIRTQDAFDDSGAAIFSDAKYKVIIYPNVDVGSQLYYRYKAIQHTPLFPGQFTLANYFNPHRRYGEVTLNLSHDASVPIQIDAQGVSGGHVDPLPDDAAGTVRYQFVYRQDTAYPAERSQLDYVDFAPHIVASTFPDYQAFGVAYHARAYPKTAVTPEIERLALNLVGDATDTKQKVRRLYNWVSKNIRYLGIYIGAGGYVPHDAASILANRYGDCKDHVVILESLLRAVGIETSPALINLGDNYKLPKLPLLVPFNHVITYVPELNIFIDSTAQFAPMGTLPLAAMDKPVLITSDGRLARTPKLSPDSNFSRTTVTMKLTPDGGVIGSSTMSKGGSQEVASRSAQFSNLNKDAAQLASRYLTRFDETGTGTIKPTEPQNLEIPWVVETEFQLDPVVNVPGPSAMSIPIGLAPADLKTLAKTRSPVARKFPAICIPVGYSEFIELKFPDIVQVNSVPKDISVVQGAYHYKSSYVLDDRTLKVTRSYSDERSDPICTSEDDADWTTFVKVLQRDLRAQVFIR
jgi:transglutaminase-like putative cysteine protease